MSDARRAVGRRAARSPHELTRRLFAAALVLVYDYHPACVTLLSKHLSSAQPARADVNGVFHDPFSADPDAPRPYTHQVGHVTDCDQ